MHHKTIQRTLYGLSTLMYKQAQYDCKNLASAVGQLQRSGQLAPAAAGKGWEGLRLLEVEVYKLPLCYSRGLVASIFKKFNPLSKLLGKYCILVVLITGY